MSRFTSFYSISDNTIKSSSKNWVENTNLLYFLTLSLTCYDVYSQFRRVLIENLTSRLNSSFFADIRTINLYIFGQVKIDL